MNISRHLDRLAIAFSAICILHCLAVPLVVAVLPIAAVGFGGDSHFHALMLWLVLPTSAFGFALGYRVHRRAGIIVLGTAGVAALTVAGIHGHDVWPSVVEAAVSVAGSLVLAAAHWSNFLEVKRLHRHGR